MTSNKNCPQPVILQQQSKDSSKRKKISTEDDTQHIKEQAHTTTAYSKLVLDCLLDNNATLLNRLQAVHYQEIKKQNPYQETVWQLVQQLQTLEGPHVTMTRLEGLVHGASRFLDVLFHRRGNVTVGFQYCWMYEGKLSNVSTTKNDATTTTTVVASLDPVTTFPNKALRTLEMKQNKKKLVGFLVACLHYRKQAPTVLRLPSAAHCLPLLCFAQADNLLCGAGAEPRIQMLQQKQNELQNIVQRVLLQESAVSG